MSLQLQEIKSANEFPEVMSCYFAAFQSPKTKFTPLLAPLRGNGPSAYSDAIKEYTARMWFWHTLDPNSHWIKVVNEDEPEKVLAGAKWIIYTSDPYYNQPEPSPLEAYWYPEGEGRKYVGMFMDKVAQIRLRRQPHILLYVSFVHPDHRRQGLGSMLMKWGTDMADKLKLDSFIEASDMGKQLYARHGFCAIGEGNVTPTIEEEKKGKEWRMLEEKCSPLQFTIMQRSANLGTVATEI